MGRATRMGQNPFAKRPISTDAAGASKRRSTRVDYVCPIVVSGRDATGQPFREETEASTVNLHGCRLRTHYQVLVGMMVTIECPATQSSAKAVCVHVFDLPSEETARDIAVQLVKPHNLWGLENPPADWETIALELVQGKAVGPVRAPVPITPSSLPVRSAPTAPAEAATAAAVIDTEAQLAVFEQRAAQLMESVLQVLRTQANEFVRDTVDAFRQQVEGLVKEAEERIRQRAEQSSQDVEASLTTLREDLAEQLSQRTDQIVANAEEALRAKVGEMFATMLKPAPKK